MTTRITFLWLLLIASGPILGQDSLLVKTVSSTAPLNKDSLRLVRKAFEQENYIKMPQLGVGAGSLYYIGELNNGERSNPLVNNYGFNVSIIQNLSPSFGLTFNYMYARITVNEEDGPWNNFRTDINSGSVQLTYNFARLLPADRVLSPFIGIGVGSFNFSSKGDLTDSQGFRYYYYENGRIMNIAESSNNEIDANPLVRDHTYESDLREENLDGLGKYSQFALSIPATVGVNLRLSNRASIQLSSTLHWTTTDLIDNISSEGLDERKGDSQNDMMLYSSLTFYYDFLSLKKQKRSKFDDYEFFSLDDKTDTDGDGVTDIEDLCPNTPKNAAVSELGCPLDTDEDGVPDYLDKEGASNPNIPVDKDGVNTEDLPPLSSDSTALRRDIRYRVYPEMAEMYKPTKKSDLPRGPIKTEFSQFDLDMDGYINVHEVYMAIDQFFEGELTNVSATDLTNLIDYFFDQ